MQTKNEKTARIAVVGGGVAGATAALYLAQLGLDITLFEKEKSLVNGPPFCHLHAGGNLYREISDAQCVKLLKQSIDFLRFYPFIVDYRPTVIALPTTDPSTPEALLPRLETLTAAYKKLIEQDASNKVLGESKDYYRLYTREAIETLREKPVVPLPQTSDEWMILVARNIDMDKIQFPLILVQEYGLNLFRLSAGLTLTLEQSDNVTLNTETIVSNIQQNHQTLEWDMTSISDDETRTEHFDYLINAAGFRSGKIDDLLGVECKRMVEFKAAYISKWDNCCDGLWPEIIFHGERGTPRGMGQFTPYPGGYFQLHGMTKEITLYEDGLVANSAVSCQPHLKQNFMEKIERSWSEDETKQRTASAIRHLSQYIPDFSKAYVASKPLFGAQQIPGDDPTLRVAEVSFPTKKYARCEIVKVSSALDMVDAIAEKLVALGYLNAAQYGNRTTQSIDALSERDIASTAEKIALARDYPAALSRRTVAKRIKNKSQKSVK